MIIQEHFYVGEHEFIRTYSDAGRYVVGGEPHGEYEEACDPVEFGRTYTEGELIPADESDAEEIVNILTGGAT